MRPQTNTNATREPTRSRAGRVRSRAIGTRPVGSERGTAYRPNSSRSTRRTTLLAIPASRLLCTLYLMENPMPAAGCCRRPWCTFFRSLCSSWRSLRWCASDAPPHAARARPAARNRTATCRLLGVIGVNRSGPAREADWRCLPLRASRSSPAIAIYRSRPRR